MTIVVATPVSAQVDEPDDRVAASRILFQPVDGAHVVIDDRRYAGTVEVALHGGGLAVVEETDVDSYLLGIREVPFAWPEEALAAQVVAARTYLAWTLANGRSPNGRRFGYDICATTACQVYAGVGGLDGPEGGRWREAVARTGGQILMAGDAPLQALYSSTSDGRTRNVEDVFVGAEPNPYLRAVESSSETSPFVSWSFTATWRQAEAILAHAGLVEGALVEVRSDRAPDGAGPWVVTVVSTGDTRTIDTWTLRTRINRAAAELYPDVFPAFRPASTRRYPQTIMSPGYLLRTEIIFVPPVDGPPRFERRLRVAGGGWGHLVGMSQYGAEAMATAGATYDQILAHYYGGLTPVAAEVLPARIRVGLSVDSQEVRLTPDGPLRVLVDGEEVSPGELGSWTVRWVDGSAIVDPPAGLGLPPDVSAFQVFFDSRGVVELVTVRSRTAAEVRIVQRENDTIVSDTGFVLREAGVIAVDVAPRSRRSALTVEITARSPLGEDSATLRILGGSE